MSTSIERLIEFFKQQQQKILFLRGKHQVSTDCLEPRLECMYDRVFVWQLLMCDKILAWHGPIDICDPSPGVLAHCSKYSGLWTQPSRHLLPLFSSSHRRQLACYPYTEATLFIECVTERNWFLVALDNNPWCKDTTYIIVRQDKNDSMIPPCVFCDGQVWVSVSWPYLDCNGGLIVWREAGDEWWVWCQHYTGYSHSVSTNHLIHSALSCSQIRTLLVTLLVHLT